MKYIKFNLILISAGLLVTPLLASANDFVIRNDTRNSLSFAIKGVCTDKFGVIGPGAIRAVPKPRFRAACKANPNNCAALVYNTADCTGTLAATVILDVDVGVRNGQAMRTYTLTWSNMRMTLAQTV